MGFSFHFSSLYPAPYIELYACVSLFKFHIWILEQFWCCPKRPTLARHIKVWVSFELFGALYMYISGPRYKILSHVNCHAVIFPCQEVLLDLVLYGWCSPFFTLITPALQRGILRDWWGKSWTGFFLQYSWIGNKDLPLFLKNDSSVDPRQHFLKP